MKLPQVKTSENRSVIAHIVTLLKIETNKPVLKLKESEKPPAKVKQHIELQKRKISFLLRY